MLLYIAIALSFCALLVMAIPLRFSWLLVGIVIGIATGAGWFTGSESLAQILVEERRICFWVTWFLASWLAWGMPLRAGLGGLMLTLVGLGLNWAGFAPLLDPGRVTSTVVVKEMVVGIFFWAGSFGALAAVGMAIAGIFLPGLIGYMAGLLIASFVPVLVTFFFRTGWQHLLELLPTTSAASEDQGWTAYNQACGQIYNCSKNDPGPVATSNGCGGENGVDVPDLAFTEACTFHDLCYEDHGKSKRYCDLTFLGQMEKSCILKNLLNPGVLTACGGAAVGYYYAVAYAPASSYYQPAQCKDWCRELKYEGK